MCSCLSFHLRREQEQLLCCSGSLEMRNGPACLAPVLIPSPVSSLPSLTESSLFPQQILPQTPPALLCGIQSHALARHPLFPNKCVNKAA